MIFFFFFCNKWLNSTLSVRENFQILVYYDGKTNKMKKKLITKKEGYRQVMKNIFTDSEWPAWKAQAKFFKIQTIVTTLNKRKG